MIETLNQKPYLQFTIIVSVYYKLCTTFVACKAYRFDQLEKQSPIWAWVTIFHANLPA